MDWNTACPDWAERIMARRSLVPALPLNDAEAARAVRVFNRMRLPDVPGQPKLAEATGDWFRDIVRALFGAFDPATNRRAIQEVFLLVPKKNGKSTNAAALMMTALILNQRPNAEALLIAPTKEIADIAFRQAEGMVKADEDLSALFHMQRHIRTITHNKSGAYLKIKAADTDAITGVLSTYILVDETHVFASKPRAADVFTEIRGAMAARPDGFMVQITTQSKTPPSGVFLAELRQARAVRDGKRRAPLLPVLYELPPGLNWRDPALFGVVNPNLGRSVDEAFLAREMAKAAEAGADAQALFASQHLNVEIGLGLLSDAWAGADHWEPAGDASLTLGALLERSDAVVVGADGGGLDDLFGLAVIGRERETRRWLVWSHAWAHPIVMRRRKEIAARLQDFAADGDLTIVEAIGQDVAEAADIIARVHETGLMPERAAIGLDPAGIGALVEALAERGIAGEMLVGINQGWRLNGAIKTAERKLAAGEMVHAAQPMLAWCVGNAKVEPRGNAVMITKQAAGSAKIDPLMAAFNAVELMARNPVPQAADGVF